MLINIAHAAAEAATEAQNNGVVALFGLNLKLFIAQLVNFAIVLFVLWKWVFTPVTNGLKARTDKIEKSLRTAEDIEKDKAEFETWKQDEMGKVRREASEVVTKAKEDALVVKNDIAEQAKQEKANILAQAQKEMVVEKEKVIGEIKLEMANLVVSASEKIIKTKLDGAKDKELISNSIKSV